MALLSLEAALIARLAARLDPAVTVRALRDVAEIERQTLPTPALLVSYGGGEVAEARPDGRAVRILQRWLVVAVVRNVANASAAAAAQDAGDLADLALTALMGWQPEGMSAPLALSELPPAGIGGGYYWLPLTFSTEMVRRVSPGP